MIKYNFPYRGPYEYDKFVLNYLQLYNDINDLYADNSFNNIHQLETIQDNLNAIYMNCSSISYNALLQELTLNKLGMI